jgi:hypothetical protein
VSQFESDEHALICGAVYAALSAAGKNPGVSWSTEPVTVPNASDHRGFDYTPFVTLQLQGGKRFRVIVAEVP